MTGRGERSRRLGILVLAGVELGCTHSRHRLGTLDSDDDPWTNGDGVGTGGTFGAPDTDAGDPSAGNGAGATPGITTLAACETPGQRLALRPEPTTVPTSEGTLEALTDGSGLDAVSREGRHACDETAGWAACVGTTSIALRFDLGANRVLEEVLAWDGAAATAPHTQIATLWLARDGGEFSNRGSMTLVADPSNCPRTATRWTIPAGEIARFIAISLELEAPLDEGALVSLGEVAAFGRACVPSGTVMVVH